MTGLALVPRLMTVAAGFRTTDEALWMWRSWRFQDALLHGNPSGASARADFVTTMPGVTTMWIGGVARVVWTAGRELGLWAQGDGEQFLTSRSALTTAQATMAVVIAIVIGLLALLVAHWAGPATAAVAGVLLATEPFLVAHGSLLHTDELSSLLGVAALVATALALGLPQSTEWAGRVGVAGLAGGLWGAAWLTKVSAVMFLLPVALLTAWAAVAAWRRKPAEPEAARRQLSRMLRQCVGWVGAAVVTIAVSYPAMWVGPWRELSFIRRSAALAGESHDNFFLGEVSETPGKVFYLVALPMRMTPWFLVATLAGVVAVSWRRQLRGFGLVLAAMAGPPLVVLSLAAKQFDRYGLPILVVAAILVGVAVGPALAAAVSPAGASGTDWAPGSRGAGRSSGLLSARPGLLTVGALGAVLAVALHSLLVAPWGLGYYNPALGGSETAQDTLLVGWGEGLDDAAAIIDRDTGGRCDQVTVWAPRLFGCGQLVRLDSSDPPAYVVIYVTDRQRMFGWLRDWLTRGRERIGTVEHRNILYLEVFGPVEAEVNGFGMTWPGRPARRVRSK